MKKAMIPGTFDPVTKGHLDVIERCSKLFDEVYVVIMVNAAKKPLFSEEERIDMIEKADADYYKMILMDIQMPVMNGYDATLAIRKMKDTKKARIPIIAMTANAFAEDAQKVLSVGMNAHVAKPVDMNILVPTMMKYL